MSKIIFRSSFEGNGPCSSRYCSSPESGFLGKIVGDARLTSDRHRMERTIARSRFLRVTTSSSFSHRPLVPPIFIFFLPRPSSHSRDLIPRSRPGGSSTLGSDESLEQGSPMRKTAHRVTESLPLFSRSKIILSPFCPFSRARLALPPLRVFFICLFTII